MITNEIRVGGKRIFAIHEGIDFPGKRLFLEIMGPNRGVYGGAFIDKEDARLIARILLEWANSHQRTQYEPSDEGETD